MIKRSVKLYLLMKTFIFLFPYASSLDAKELPKPNGYSFNCGQAYSHDNIKVIVENGLINIQSRLSYVSKSEKNIPTIKELDTFSLTIPSKDCVWSATHEYLFNCSVQNITKLNAEITYFEMHNNKKKLKSKNSVYVVNRANIFMTKRSTIYTNGKSINDEIILNITYLNKHKQHKIIKVFTQNEMCNRIRE